MGATTMKRLGWWLGVAFVVGSCAGCLARTDVPEYGRSPGAVEVSAAATAWFRGDGNGCSVTPTEPPLAARHCYDDDNELGPDAGGDVLDPDGHWYDVVEAYQPDPERDLVVLTLDEPLPDVVPFGPDPEVFEPVWTAGYGCALNHTDVVVHVGVVIGVSNSKYYLALVPPVCGGDSGGPLLNSRGEVVGVVVARTESGLGLAVPLPPELRP